MICFRLVTKLPLSGKFVLIFWSILKHKILRENDCFHRSYVYHCPVFADLDHPGEPGDVLRVHPGEDKVRHELALKVGHPAPVDGHAHCPELMGE